MKLLDEKGLTTVWAAIKNTFTSKSDADGKYAEKSKALGSINFNYTAYGLNMSTYNVDGDSYGYINITPATSKIAGVMTALDKAKLDGIASGANNYTLPTASEGTLGGIKVSANANGSSWPICVDDNGLAKTKINGLVKNGDMLSIVALLNETYFTNYTPRGVHVEDRESKTNVNINFPAKSGVFALTSDIPDVPNICRFNFVNNISECKSDRINFLFKNSNDYVDLSFLNNLEEGTILLIYSPRFEF